MDEYEIRLYEAMIQTLYTARDMIGALPDDFVGVGNSLDCCINDAEAIGGGLKDDDDESV
jgi:hypothetical protein|tara:strand:- start:542 stop:721 length:180 start_codon:yes stop_codon:yes gene_type:complete